MSIRSRLIALALAVLVPAVLLAAASIAYVYREEQQAYQRSLRETSRALALVVDKEIARREELLRSLAASPYLDRPDLAAFYEQARRLSPGWDSVIVLADAEGHQLLNTRRAYPPQERLPRNITFPDLRERHGREATIVSGLYLAPIGKGYSFAVEVPVVRDGKVRYYVAMGTFASQLQAVFEEQRLPEGWTVAILDAEGRIAARNIDPDKHVGQPARADLVEHSRTRSEGFFYTRTRDGVPVTAFFSKVPRAGWTLAIGVPKNEILASASAATRLMGLGLALLLGLAVVLAVAFGRGIVGPVRRLALEAERLGRGEPVQAPPSAVSEIAQVGSALESASLRIQDASAEMQRQVKLAVEQAERSQRELLQVQKLDALGRLTGGIAHDFNNLLQTISTGLQLAGASLTDANSRFAIESCRRAVEQATRLTRQLTAFARGQSSQRSAVDLRTKLLGMTELLRGALRSNIELRFEVAEDLWPVEIDPLQMELALLNLAINARDAIPAGGRVGIRAANCRLLEHDVPRLAPGEYVRLDFEDDGKGMSAEVLERAVDPFFTTKEVGKGSGLGLPQVYAFARQAGGALVLESEPGRGTRARIYLPRLADAVPGTPAAAQQPTNYERLCVLLVEDEEMVRDIAVPALRGQGFRVIAARNAEEALEMLEANREVDAVFSDIVMPGRYSGVDLADLVRQRHGPLPVLLATGYSEQVESAKRYPVVAKPYDFAEVATKLRALAAPR